ncbi:MAG TPA: sulfite exporter TauE/SafE family protein [Burkholderiales bacterium]|nr:sulfite exporter TauE/SafE family protein [Burkholderiales bacterium]
MFQKQLIVGQMVAMVSFVLLPGTVFAAAQGSGDLLLPWWVWPILLMLVCFILGIIAVPAGVGGGVLFVPIVGGFFPFHLDFVRGTGLLVALASALASSPALLRIGLANLRLALPLALLVSATSIVGAHLGLMLPAPIAQTALGLTVLGIVVLMWRAKKSDYPEVRHMDGLAGALKIGGIFHDAASGKEIAWTSHRTPEGFVAFLGTGLIAGMFGLGAGWANVPALNLLMGVPLKVAAGTSSLVLSMTSSAAWVYINEGAVLPMIAAPSIIGMMLGAFIGTRLLAVINAATVRRLVMAILLFAGIRALMKGLGIWS